MTADALMVVQFLFSTIWRFFNSWKIPGTGVTPAMFLIFSLFFVFVLKFVVPRILSLVNRE